MQKDVITFRFSPSVAKQHSLVTSFDLQNEQQPPHILLFLHFKLFFCQAFVITTFQNALEPSKMIPRSLHPLGKGLSHAWDRRPWAPWAAKGISSVHLPRTTVRAFCLHMRNWTCIMKKAKIPYIWFCIFTITSNLHKQNLRIFPVVVVVN